LFFRSFKQKKMWRWKYDWGLDWDGLLMI
jgi:hypothetical protein